MAKYKMILTPNGPMLQEEEKEKKKEIYGPPTKEEAAKQTIGEKYKYVTPQKQATQTSTYANKNSAIRDGESRDEFDSRVRSGYTQADNPVPEYRNFNSAIRDGESRDEFDSRVRSGYTQADNPVPEYRNFNSAIRDGESRDDFDSRVRASYTQREEYEKRDEAKRTGKWYAPNTYIMAEPYQKEVKRTKSRVKNLRDTKEYFTLSDKILKKAEADLETNDSEEARTFYRRALSARNRAEKEYLAVGEDFDEVYAEAVAEAEDAVKTYNEYIESEGKATEEWKVTVRRDSGQIEKELEAAKEDQQTIAGQYKQAEELFKAYEWALPEGESFETWANIEWAVNNPGKADRTNVRNLAAYNYLQKVNLEKEYNSINNKVANLEEELYYSKLFAHLDDPEIAKNTEYVSTRKGPAHIEKEKKYIPFGGGTYDANEITDTGYEDILYDYINKNTAVVNMHRKYNIPEIGKFRVENPHVEEMTPDEIGIFNALYKKDKTTAYDYVRGLGSDLKKRNILRQRQELREYAEENPVAATAMDLASYPMKVIAGVANAGNYLINGKIDEDAWYNEAVVNSAIIREAVTENWGRFGKFGYGVGMSLAEYAVTLGIGKVVGSAAKTAGAVATKGAANKLTSGVVQGIMSSRSMADTAVSAKRRGLTDKQAFSLGVVSAAAEAITEKYSLDALFDSGKTGWSYVLQNVATEGSEEAASNAINFIADVALSKDKSEWKQSINAYREKGDSKGEAFGKAFGNQLLSMGTDALAGMISGGVISGSVNIVNSMAVDRANRAEENEMVRGMQEWFAERKTNSEPSYRIGRTVENKPFVEVEEDVLDGIPEEEWTKTVKQNLKEKFPKGIIAGNNTINIDNKSRKEMTYSGYMKWLYNNEPDVFADKLRATNNADEIVLAATNWVNEAKGHERNDNIESFARGKTLIKIGGRDYLADVVVATRNNGNMLLYDILNLSPTSITEKETDVLTAVNPSPEAHRSNTSISNKSIPQTTSSSQENNNKSFTIGRTLPRAGESGPVLPTAKEEMAARERQRRAAEATTETERTGILYGATEENIEMAGRISKAIGRDVVFYENADSGVKNDDGYYNSRDGKIYINAKSKNAVARIISHEMTHSVELADSYIDLFRTVIRRIQKTGGNIQEMRSELKSRYGKNGVELSRNAEIDAEIMAEYMAEHLFTDEASITSLAKESPESANAILRFLDNLLAKLGNTNAQERVFVAKARNLYAKALGETQGRREGQGQSAAETGVTGTNAEKAQVSGKGYRSGRTPDGKPYIEIQEDILAGVSEKDRAKAVGDYLKESLPANGNTFSKYGRGSVTMKIGDTLYTADVVAGVQDGGKALPVDVLSLKQMTSRSETAAETTSERKQPVIRENVLPTAAERFGNRAVEAKEYKENNPSGASHHLPLHKGGEVAEVRAEKDGMAEEKVANNTKPWYNKRKKAKISKLEYARVSSAIMQKNAGKQEGELPEVDYVYAADNFYVYANHAIGEFSVLQKFNTETEREKITAITRWNENEDYRNAIELASAFEGKGQDGRRGGTRHNVNAGDGGAYAGNGGVLDGKSERNPVGRPEEGNGNQSADFRSGRVEPKETTEVEAIVSETLRPEIAENAELMEMLRAQFGADGMAALAGQIKAEVEKTGTVGRFGMLFSDGGRSVEEALGANKISDGGERQFAISKDEDVEGIFSAPREVTEKLSAQVDSWLAGEMGSSDVFDIGQTPMVLQQLGASDLPVSMSQEVMTKITGEKHNIALDEIKRLPQAIAEPIMVFQSATVQDALVILTELSDKNGNDVVVAMHLNRRRGFNNINRISSAYGKNNIGNFISQQIEAGNLKYADKKMSQEWLRSRGLQLPKLNTILNSTNSILEKEDIVNSYRAKKSEKYAQDAENRKSSISEKQEEERQYAIGKEKGVAKEDGKRYNKETYRIDKQSGVMWTLQKGVLTNVEVSAFYEKISEMRSQKYKNYVISADGDFIFEVGNKLIYTDGNYRNPHIENVIEFNTKHETVLTEARRLVYECENNGTGTDFAYTIIETVYGQEFIKQANYGNSETDGKFDGRGEGENGEAADSRGGENGGWAQEEKQYAITKDPIDTETTTEHTETTENADFWDEWLEKVKEYGAMEKGEKPARDIKVPKKIAKDKPVSQTVRTILEAKVTPDEAIPTIEQMVLDGDFSYDVHTDKKAIKNADGKIEKKGYTTAFGEWAKDMDAGKVSKENTALGWALYNQAATSGDIKTATTILNKMVQHQRNAAQALQATRILKQLSPEGQLYQAVNSVEALKQELKEKYGDKAPDLKIDENLAKEFLEARTQKERDEIKKKIYRDIGRQMPSRFIEKWNAWRYLAMLGNPRTHIRNIVGNAGFAPVVAAKNLAATTVESMVYRVSGGKMGRTKAFIVGTKYDRALLSAAWNDYKNVAEMISNGGKYNDAAMAAQSIEEGRRVFKFAPLEAARKGNSWLLEAEDVWFSKPHYAYALAQYCKANHISAKSLEEGKLLDAAREYAIKEAQKATYKDTNAFSQMVSGWGRSRGKSDSGVKKSFNTAVEGILPFRKTPANILVRGLEYSPLGLLKSVTADIARVKKGEIGGAELIDNISAGLTGTGLLALGVYLAAQGLIRGHGGEDEDENTFEELQGHQAYSLELSDGTSITLDWLAPEALPFFVGVNLWEATKGSEDKVNLSAILQSVTSISEPMLEMSCLQSLNDLLDSIAYVKKEEQAPLVAILASAATSYLTQALPTLFRQTELAGETESMATYTGKNDWLTGDMQYTLGKMSAKIPGWDFSQIPYIDAWGRKEEIGERTGKIVNIFLNPAGTSKVNTSKTEEELLQLYDATGDAGVFPDRAKKYFTVDGERKDLTAEEYVKYATEKGQKAYKVITSLTGSNAYKTLTDNEKVKTVKEAYEYADQKAKKAVNKSYKTDKWVSTADDFGSNIGSYLSFRSEMNNTKKEKGGGLSKREVADIVLDMAQSDSDVWKMYLSMYDSDNDMYAYSEGVAGKTYMEFLSLLNEVDEPTKSGKYGTYTQEEAKKALQKMAGVSGRDKAILWQSVNQNWKATNRCNQKACK